MRYKAMTVYHYLGIKTAIITADEYLNSQNSKFNKIKK